MSVFYRNFFTVYLFFPQFLLLLFMTDAGRYAPVLGNETLHGRMLLESTVHMSVKVRRSFIGKQYIQTLNFFFSCYRYPVSSPLN